MKHFDVNDSIAAIASPPGNSPRGVIRMSGPSIHESLQQCFESAVDVTLDSQKQPALLNGFFRVASPLNRVAVDLYYWPTTASYTRQRSAELHCTGSAPVLNEVMRALAECGVRQAQPGEFTMRAFLAGRIDLTRAEAVLGVIDSASEQQMDVALKQLAGGLSGPLTQLQDHLLETLANIEAGLDFVEDDIEFITRETIQANIADAQSTLDGVIKQMSTRHIDAARKKIVLRGRPNAGKSCLQNALCESEVAIVSDVAGTTRDYLVGQMQLGSQLVDVVDTAGTMESLDAGAEFVEQASNASQSQIQDLSEIQANRLIEQADIQVVCLDGSEPRDSLEIAWLEQFAGDPKLAKRTVFVATKADLPEHPSWVPVSGVDVFHVSSVNRQGLDQLRHLLERRLGEITEGDPSGNQIVTSTANRCRESLLLAAEELEKAEAWARAGEGDEIIAASLRVVLDELAVVTGKVFTDDILDRVFSNFCIGK